VPVDLYCAPPLRSLLLTPILNWAETGIVKARAGHCSTSQACPSIETCRCRTVTRPTNRKAADRGMHRESANDGFELPRITPITSERDPCNQSGYRRHGEYENIPIYHERSRLRFGSGLNASHHAPERSPHSKDRTHGR
jgi:hypothetical protein